MAVGFSLTGETSRSVLSEWSPEMNKIVSPLAVARDEDGLPLPTISVSKFS